MSPTQALGGLSSLLGAAFIISYFIPVVGFVFALLTLSYGWEAESFPAWLVYSFRDNLLIGASFSVFCLWLASVFLLLLNRPILRFLEGYGRINPLWLFIYVERFRLHRLNNKLETTGNELKKIKKECKVLKQQHEKVQSVFEKRLEELENEWIRLNGNRVVRFPSSDKDLLPTPLGNAILAFEGYPLDVYGLSGIQPWTRLFVFIPEHLRQAIDDAKMGMDAWVNTTLLAAVFSLIAVFRYVAYSPQGELALLAALLAVALVFVAYFLAVEAAIIWGHWMKAPFDLYQKELAAALGMRLPSEIALRKDFWQYVSQLMVYKHRPALSCAQKIAQGSKAEEERAEGQEMQGSER